MLRIRKHSKLSNDVTLVKLHLIKKNTFQTLEMVTLYSIYYLQ